MTSMGAPSRGKQAEAAAPKVFTPKLLPYPRILLFKQAVTGALVNVDELAQLALEPLRQNPDRLIPERADRQE